MALPQPPLGGGGPQVPPPFASQLAKASGSKWSALGSSLVVFAFSLRLLGDKYEHQARDRGAPRRGARRSADAVAPRRTLCCACTSRCRRSRRR
jgi:hypothetical protein